MKVKIDKGVLRFITVEILDETFNYRANSRRYIAINDHGRMFTKDSRLWHDKFYWSSRFLHRQSLKLVGDQCVAESCFKLGTRLSSGSWSRDDVAPNRPQSLKGTSMVRLTTELF